MSNEHHRGASRLVVGLRDMLISSLLRPPALVSQGLIHQYTGVSVTFGCGAGRRAYQQNGGAGGRRRSGLRAAAVGDTLAASVSNDKSPFHHAVCIRLVFKYFQVNLGFSVMTCFSSI